ncbi:MAG: hypothetical protein K2G20_07295 [Lachnospiraceae bacterium]|nr:hypothetical protein [Lachnospiraceae bacterium]
MTRKQLEQYKSKKAEIGELEAYIRKLGSDESLMGSSTVFDYRSGYPKPQAVVGVDRAEYWKKKERYEKKIEQLKAECEEAERFVEGIEDSLTRRIFRMYFLDGTRQEDIAAAVHIHRSRISRKISDFLKKAHKAQKEMV